jgi:putative transposase
MGKKRRSWSTNEKLQILREGDLYGMTETMRRHNLSSSMYYKWKAQLLGAKTSNSAGQTASEVDIEKVELEEEIARLRKVIADQAVALSIKNELLKKTALRSKTNEKL